jgi:hypothetical protein
MLRLAGYIELFYIKLSHASLYLNEKVNRYSFLLLFINAIVTVSIVVWSLNRGLIFSDESWYLLLLNNNMPNVSISEWPSYAREIYPLNLLAIRYLTFCFYIISGTFLSFCISRYFKISFVHIFLLSLSILFIFWSPVQFVPNYVTFNILIFNVGIGCFLFMLSGTTVKSIYIWGVACGFIFGNLVFIMITNTPFIGILLISFIFLKKKEISIFHYWVSIFSGILLTVAVFFTTIKSFNQYINDLDKVFSYLPLIQGYGYGIKGLSIWLLNTFLYFTREVFIQALLLFYIFSNNNKSKSVVYLSFFLFACYTVYYLIQISQTDGLNITSPTPIYILMMFIVISLVEKNKWQTVCLLLLFLLLPVFASLGTDVKFKTRSVAYLTPLILLTYGFLRNEDFSKFILIFHGILFLTLIRFSTIFISQPGWQGYIIKDQNINISEIGIKRNLKLDKKTTENVRELKELIPAKSLVLINDANFWGYVYLLDLKVPYFYFRFDEKGLDNYLLNSKLESTSLYLMENPDWQFPNNLKQIKNIISIDTIPLYKIKDMNLYRIVFQ